MERNHYDADKEYLKILKIAADEGVTTVENALEELLSVMDSKVDAAEVLLILETWQDLRREWLEHQRLEVNLADYDALLGNGDDDAEDSEWVGKEASDVIE